MDTDAIVIGIGFIVSLLGGLAATLVTLYYTKNNRNAQTNLANIQAERISLEISQHLKEAKELQEQRASELKNIEEKISQITTFKNFKDAFSELTVHIEQYLEDQSTNDVQPITVNLKLLAVAMSFSWNYISTDLMELLDKYRSVTFRLDILFVNYEHLENLEIIPTDGIDWIERSRSHIKNIRDLHMGMATR